MPYPYFSGEGGVPGQTWPRSRKHLLLAHPRLCLRAGNLLWGHHKSDHHFPLWRQWRWQFRHFDTALLSWSSV